MTTPKVEVNATTAPLTNVALFGELVDRLVGRPRHLPGIGLFYGFSGLGKTWSAVHAAHKSRARYIEAGESWTRGKFLKALAIEVGVDPRGTAADLVERIIMACESQDRPIIIDEADHLVRRGVIETIREIADKSGVPIILIGEEGLWQAIATRSERTHNRVLSAVAAQLATAEDVSTVAGLYYPHLTIAFDLVEMITARSAGRIRRAVVNLHRVAEVAAGEGWDTVDLGLWGGRELFTGQVGTMRAAENVSAKPRLASVAGGKS